MIPDRLDLTLCKAAEKSGLASSICSGEFLPRSRETVGWARFGPNLKNLGIAPRPNTFEQSQTALLPNRLGGRLVKTVETSRLGSSISSGEILPHFGETAGRRLIFSQSCKLQADQKTSERWPNCGVSKQVGP